MSTASPPQQAAIEKRVATLEQQMAELLRAQPAGGIEGNTKSWVSTVGTWKDDTLSREADQLGEAWRKSVTD